MIQLQVSRRDGKYPADKLQETFQRYGIVVLKELIPASYRSELRALLERKLSEGEAQKKVLHLPIYPRADFLLGDVLAIREMEKYDYIFFCDEVLDVVRTLLESRDLLYFGDSSVQFGEGGRGFHKDNVNRYDGSHNDWRGDYGLLRCGLYMQDHVIHSGGLKVRLCSHNYPNHLEGQIADVATAFGDLAIWSKRLTHSGNTRKLRLFPWVPLHPRLEMICPAVLRAPEQMRRISVFCSFGRPGSHTDTYIDNLGVRANDYKEYLRRARHPREAEPLLKKKRVSLVAPFPYYGELD